MKESTYVMWLTRIEGLGIKKQELLLEHFGTARDIWFANEKLLKTLTCIKEQHVIKILKSKSDDILEIYEEELFKKKIMFITKFEPTYPNLLKEIYNPPIGIYIKGNLPSEKYKKVSIIGSRKCSEYGMTVSYKLSKDLAKNKVVVVSGMAKGIDASAHRGAIDGDFFTIAVLGCGIDVCYPAENRTIRERIIEKGCLLSEYPPSTQPIPAYFPIRNRIISGLSAATIVVEAAKKSGTLITVEQALEQGREVFAVPGNITSKLSHGTNDLIKQGATLVSDATDVLENLGIEKKTEFNEEIEKNINKLLAPSEKLVYDCISFQPISIEEVVIKTNSQIPTVQYIVTMLELKGFINKLPGQRYIRSL